MNNKTKLLALIGAVVAVILLTVAIVGLVNGTWPWEDNGWFSGDYNGMPGKNTTSTTGDGTTNDTTDGTSDSTSNTTEGGNTAQKPAQKEEGDISLDINIGIDTSTTETTEVSENNNNNNTSGNNGNVIHGDSISFDDLMNASTRGAGE